MRPVREVEPSGSSDLGSRLIKTTDLYIQRERDNVKGWLYLHVHLISLLKTEGNKLTYIQHKLQVWYADTDANV